MPGFSQFDHYYYAHPSVKMGGWIAFVLMKTNQHTLNLEPGAEGFFSGAPLIRHESLEDLRDSLLKQHGEDIYYRGQSRRYSCVSRQRVPSLSAAVPHIRDLSIRHESIFPSQYRSVIKNGECDWESFKNPPLMQQLKHVIRAISSSKNDALRSLLKVVMCNEMPLIAMKIAMADGDSANLSLKHIDERGTNVPENLLKLISIAQHYEFPTVMVDLSSSLDVASWFATHSWGDGKPFEKGEGVIYRFNKRAIMNMVRMELDKSFLGNAHKMEACASYGIADINNMDSSYGLRPKVQHGASIFGLENTFLYLLMHYSRIHTVKERGQSAMEEYGFTAHAFPIEKESLKKVTLSKAELTPSVDPVLQVFTAEHLHDDKELNKEEVRHFLQQEKAPNSAIKDVHRFMDLRLI
jgi:hypothetical protein